MLGEQWGMLSTTVSKEATQGSWLWLFPIRLGFPVPMPCWGDPFPRDTEGLSDLLNMQQCWKLNKQKTNIFHHPKGSLWCLSPDGEKAPPDTACWREVSISEGAAGVEAPWGIPLGITLQFGLLGAALPLTALLPCYWGTSIMRPPFLHHQHQRWGAELWIQTW